MKKRIWAALVAFILVCPLVSIVAHPGNTDEEGGHYVDGTSEYHWHHGLEAHEHIDVDGDGVLDCILESPERKLDNFLFGFLGIVVLFGLPVLSMLLMGISVNLRKAGRINLSKVIRAISVFVGIINILGSIIVYFILGDVIEPWVMKICNKLVPSKQISQMKKETETEYLCGTIMLNSSRAQHKKFCNYLWKKTLAFINTTRITRTYGNCACVFAVFFYTSVKVARSRNFASEVYLHLSDVVAESVREQDEHYADTVLHAYREIAPELNHSGISPLNKEGAECLWEFLLQRLYKITDINEESKALFLCQIEHVVRNTQNFIETAKTFYPFSDNKNG